MKKIFRRLACCSFLSIASIGCFDVDARVTKEVAEAVLPFLMEAAGIEGDKHSDTTKKANETEYENNKIKAILDMIYTDEGQRQMVNWVQTGEFPTILKEKFGTYNTYQNKYYRDSSLASLFPCQTGTFTSYANHDTRLGKHILKKPNAVCEQIQSLLRIKCHQKFDDIVDHIDAKRHKKSGDTLLAKIIFAIDCCDSLEQIATSLNVNIDSPNNAESEYTCRPVSAIVARNNPLDQKSTLDGDCVETLYKHLVHIAIQDQVQRHIFHAEKLPNELYKYHDSNYSVGSDKSPVEIATISEAGTTSIDRHNTWKQCLKNHVPDINISFGSWDNIAEVLARVAGIEHNGNNLLTIQNALNYLATNKTFEISFCDSVHAPLWCDTSICITEKSHVNKTIRKIYVGICSLQQKNKGHAEILKIKQYK